MWCDHRGHLRRLSGCLIGFQAGVNAMLAFDIRDKAPAHWVHHLFLKNIKVTVRSDITAL